MFNYHNLNDVEFEELCKDVMERKLSASLRLFSRGRDGGIDLTDNTYTHNIIVQVKHYIRSKYSNLRTSLRNEVEKVRMWHPNQYFVCCGMELTDGNIREIYEMFLDFMPTDKNVVTLNEIDEFLQNPENTDIVRKHHKLWLYSSNILSEVYNQNIFIDCETLFCDIDEDSRFFVPTKIYEQCVELLDNNGLLMITGGPGVGKTITSKMLVLYYATQGYRVRYTTNGDINDIKKSLSSEKETKEIVLLDDCLGQHYFNMKQTQENELLSLIKYVKLSNNKKLILNSRITIFNEAKERSIDFNIFFQQKKIRIYTINMDDITPLEKAKIFYNHLKFKNIPSDYYNSIKENKHYLKIVQHKNYTPRIIEHVTYEHNYLKETPTLYFNYIFDTLANPNDIWKNEFEQRLLDIDRAFLSTLYSLTDTNVEHDIFKKCFYKRLSRMKNIDFTIDNWSLVLSRLNQSIINIIDLKGKKHIGVINPSVNDYLKIVFMNNSLELDEVRNSICYFAQFERCYSKEELPHIYHQYIVSEKINEIEFFSVDQKNYFITAQICKNGIINVNYSEIITDYLNNSYCYNYSTVNWLTHFEIINSLLSDELYSFYSINQFINKQDNIKNLMCNLNLDELIFTINLLNDFFKIKKMNFYWFKLICKELMEDTIIDYIENIDTSDYCDNYDIGELIRENTKRYWFRGDEEDDIDKDSAVSDLEKKISADIEKEIQEKLSSLEENIINILTLPESYSLNTIGIENAIDSYLKDTDYDDYDRYSSSEVFITEIEAIFER
ncbi:restriction endonuclease [Fontibacillus phaseoli]|uniref:Restriction endonuclease n=1 Tax=Fontibacillus phaseoli TaxID=1416533 RepID=A0A369BP70_9BACL|nr:restriction endonuclease [Fontibacillus phaseoli]RCX23333.1 restriction endonuclease [Fontibacillus phaseoli]